MTHAEKTLSAALEKIWNLTSTGKTDTFKTIARIADNALTYAWDDEKQPVDD